MVDITAPEPLDRSRAKSVQDHIDELPMWADGTPLRSVRSISPHNGCIAVQPVAIAGPRIKLNECRNWRPTLFAIG